MPAYLTSVSMYPSSNVPEEQGIRNLTSAVLLDDSLPDGSYSMSWDLLTDPKTKISSDNSTELCIGCDFTRTGEDEPMQRVIFHALPFFSSEILREKLNHGVGSNPFQPKTTYRHAFAALRDVFDGLNPLDMVDQLRSIQERYFLDGLRRVVAFSDDSEADHSFRRLHQIASLLMTQDGLQPHFEGRPLVLHPGMQDHIFFKDLESLQKYGHVHPIDLENFGPDDTSQIDYD